MRANVLLVGINAKYIHANLAIRCMSRFAEARGHKYDIAEFTINQRCDYILSSIYKKKPDILGFSCYIWNIGIVSEVVRNLKKILPNTIIVLGGPEMYDYEPLCDVYDYIIEGAGEEAFYELVSAVERGEAVVKGKIVAEKFDFQNSVFPYTEQDFGDLANRIIYYEAQRGCPFSCSYCLSSISGGVVALPVERVFGELSVFLRNNVRQVKFVDRTFNCDKSFRRAVWTFLIENDNGKTNFHFEITAELLDNVDFELLKRARAGLFQFEIGVQSTNERTLAAINRPSRFDVIAKNVGMLLELKNVHLHLDLIAGLPYEGFEAFKRSFNDVFSLSPDVLQLGFLKALKGSAMRENADKYGLVYCDAAPYEVLSTNDLSFGELLSLKNTEHVLESYYNSGLAVRTLRFFLRFFETPFDMFYELGKYWDNRGCFDVSHTKIKMFEILLDFFESVVESGEKNVKIAREAVLYDVLKNDNVKTFPASVEKPLTDSQKTFVNRLYGDTEALTKIDKRLAKYDKKQLYRRTSVVFFDYEIDGAFEKRDTVILFHYLDGSGSTTDVSQYMEELEND